MDKQGPPIELLSPLVDLLGARTSAPTPGGKGSEFRLSGFGVSRLGFRVQGFGVRGFKVRGFGFTLRSQGFGIRGFRCMMRSQEVKEKS